MSRVTPVHLTTRHGRRGILAKLAEQVNAGLSVPVEIPSGTVLDDLYAVQYEQGWEIIGLATLMPRERLMREVHEVPTRRDVSLRGRVKVRLPRPAFPTEWAGERIRQFGDFRAIACTPGANPDPNVWEATES
jgi:hypothetical protein